LVIQAGAMGRGGEIFVLDMGEPVKIVDLARDMIRLSGLELGQDIDIQFVGQRPGEKLFEELNCDGERHRPTSHPKIMVAESGRVDLAVLQGALEQIQQIADGSVSPIIAALQNIVPQYALTKAASQPRSGVGGLRAGTRSGPESTSSADEPREIIPIGEPLGRPPQNQRKAA
jgi:FlaA1/EpsC-like NDP-sugar epimerase